MRADKKNDKMDPRMNKTIKLTNEQTNERTYALLWYKTNEGNEPENEQIERINYIGTY